MGEPAQSVSPPLARVRQRVPAVLSSPQVQTAITFAVFLVVWEVAVAVFRVRPYILPAPSAIVRAGLRSSVQLVRASQYTIQSILVGYVTAVVVGVVMALPIALSGLMRRTVYPMLVLSQLVPKVALAPIFVIWFGFSLLPKITVVFLLSFFPVVLNGIVGLQSIDPEIIHLTRSTGATTWDTFFRVRLPYALPNFFAGFKLAAISATVGGVIGEFIGSDNGLGYVILIANGDLHTDLSFAAIVTLTVLGLLLYYAVEFLERLSIPWHQSQRITGEQPQGL